MFDGGEMTVRRLRDGDWRDWLGLRRQLWPDSDEADARNWAGQDAAVVLIAESSQDGVVGFAEVGLRAYADGCATSPVAFLEGWYVRPLDRGKGVGGALVRAAAVWAQERGARELASDSLLEKADAHAAHLRVGFEEVERSIKYRMAVESVVGRSGRK